MVSRQNESFLEGLRSTPVSVPIIAISFVAGGMISWLALYHISLISQGITTNEDYKASRSRYDLGFRLNMINAVCGVVRPSRLITRDMVAQGAVAANRTFPVVAVAQLNSVSTASTV